jgi:hypothetical protein
MSGHKAETLRQNRFGAALAHISGRRRNQRGREKRGKPELPPVAAAAPSVPRYADEPDPVQIAVLAIETLGPASMRASCTGTEVRVTAPDEAMAAIFRAALAETGRNRATDRLIRVVIE